MTEVQVASGVQTGPAATSLAIPWHWLTSGPFRRGLTLLTAARHADLMLPTAPTLVTEKWTCY